MKGVNGMAMRTTLHNGRGYGTKHNDRNFNLAQADHIDPERSKNNIYRNCYGDPGLTFHDATLRFYEERFGAQLEATNAGYIRNRHPERCKSMEQWMRSKQHGPEESIVQVGDMNSSIPGAVLWECYEDLERRLGQWSAEHGNPFSVISEALHVDEQGAAHVHRCRVWHYQDGEQLRIGQERALEAAGVELPDPTKAPGRHNNRKMAFDKMAREMWLEVLQEHGIQVETVPVPDGKHNRTQEQMIRDKYAAMIEATQQLREVAEQLQEEIEPYRELKVALDEVDRVIADKTIMGRVVAKPQDLEPLQEQAKAYRANRDEIADARDKETFLGEWHDQLNDREAELDVREQQLDDRERELDLQKQRNRDIYRIAERAEQRGVELAAENDSLKAENHSLRDRVKRLERGLNDQLRTFQSRLRASYEAMTAVIRATGVFQKNRILDAVKRFAADKAKEAGFEDLAAEMQQPKISEEIRQHIEPEQPRQSVERQHNGPNHDEPEL